MHINKNKMLNFFRNLNSFKANRLVFGQETPDHIPSQSASEHREETIKEIVKGVREERLALKEKIVTDIALETDESDKNHLLKESTYILISQKGKDSKHNTAGWKGLALPTDSIKILSPKVTIIRGKEYIRSQVKHKLLNNKYRTYVGYILKSAFKDSAEVRAVKQVAERSEEEINIKEIYAKFKKLFEKYPTTNASTGISFKENIIGKSWTIAYRKSETSPREPQLIKITVDTSKKPYDFNVNGQHTADPEAAYMLAESILKRAVEK